MIRPCSVAGSFYPSDPGALVRAIQECFRCGSAPAPAAPPKALVCPHAGYVYSGASAASAYAALDRDRQIGTVVIIGPNHTGLGPPVSVSAAEEWATPLGPAPVDRERADDLCARCHMAAPDDLAHSREHSIEVQIPFLQVRLSKPFRILPIALSAGPTPAGHEACAELGRSLAEVFRGRSVLFVASTDMSHYLSAADARLVDRSAIDAVLALDSARLVQVVREHEISMCGVMATAAVIEAARALGASKAELADYRNSGQVSGDESQVVSYAAFTIH